MHQKLLWNCICILAYLLVRANANLTTPAANQTSPLKLFNMSIPEAAATEPVNLFNLTAPAA